MSGCSSVTRFRLLASCPVTAPVADPLGWLVDLEGVPSAYAAARDGIDVMLRDRGLRRTSPEMTAESLLRGAHASAVLEGSTSSLAEVRAGDGRRDRAGRAPALGLPAGAGAAAQDRAAAGDRPSARGRRRRLGARRRPRSSPRRGVGRPVARRLGAAPVRHDRPRTARGGGRARRRGDGRALRLAQRDRRPRLERLVLVARGVDAKSLVVPEAGHLALRAQYESNLRGYAEGGPRGVHAWAALRRRGVRRGRGGVAAAAYGRRGPRPADMRTAPDLGDRMPSLTRECLATKRATSNCCPGQFPVTRALFERVDRRVGTRLTCRLLSCASCRTPSWGHSQGLTSRRVGVVLAIPRSGVCARSPTGRRPRRAHRQRPARPASAWPAGRARGCGARPAW